MTAEAPRKGKGNVGEFFALDRDAWPAVCGQGLNAAVAYVVLARFSGRDNVHTSASVQAIEGYTGMGRERAREAIKALIDARLVDLVPESPRTRPRYILRPCRDVWNDTTAARAKRLPTPSAERNLAWLPNAFVTGAASEVPPLKRLRETGNVEPLRLVVELYAAHHLNDDGGVSTRVVWQPWERHLIAETEHYRVLGFTRPQGKNGPITGMFNDKSRAWRECTDAWKSMGTIAALGLVEVVTTVFDGPEGEPVYPVAFEPMTEAPDAKAIRACGLWAKEAAEVWGGERVLEWCGEHQGEHHVLMLPRHVAEASLRGVYRLRYRPRTNATARWWGKLMRNTEAWTAKFRDLTMHPQYERESTG